MTAVEIKRRLMCVFEPEEAIYTSSGGGVFTLYDAGFSSKRGKFAGRACLRYVVPSGGGVRKRIFYDELLRAYELRHSLLPDGSRSRWQECLRDSCIDGSCCIAVARELIARLSQSSDTD